MKNIIVAALLAASASVYAQDSGTPPLDLTYHGSNASGMDAAQAPAVDAEKPGRSSSCSVDLKSDPLTYAAVAAIVADWGTTRNVAKDPRHFRETGPAAMFIGNTPSMGQINTYFMGVIAVNLAARCYAPKWTSNLFLGISTVAHGKAAIGNYQVGAKISF